MLMLMLSMVKGNRICLQLSIDDDVDDDDGVTTRSDSRAVPVTLPCEHTYCSECIRRSISYSSENSTPKCPLNYCNEAASEKLLKKHGLLEQMMEVCRV